MKLQSAPQPIHSQDLLDRTGIVLSAVCLVHCTVLPLLFAAAQAWGANLVPKSWDSEYFHLVFAIVLLGVGGLAFLNGYRRHGQIQPLFAGVFGTLLLFLGAFAVFPSLGEAGEHGLTIAGTVVLLWAHFKNRQGLKHRHVHSGNCSHGH